MELLLYLKGENLLSNYLDCIGEIRYNHFGTPMKIIAARKKSDIDVQFLDPYGYIKEHSTYNSFKKGEIRNPYDRTANGIGYNGVGKYKTGGSAYDTKVFAIWYAILGRCYNEQRRDKSPSYEKCFICDEWMDYQKFRAWYDDNFYQVGTERMHIDKDILYKNNKIYSPKTCIIVPQRINMLFLGKLKDNGMPLGVHKDSSGRDAYFASYNGKHLGTFSTPEEAGIAHDKEKKKVIIDVANEYKDVIPEKVYNALLNWIPDCIEY